MNYIYIILFLIAIIELTFIHSALFNDEIIALDLLGGNNLFVLAFILFSIPQIFFESYSVIFTLLTVIGAASVSLIILKLRRAITFNKKRFINKEFFFVLCILAMISVLFLRRTVEDIRSISDQGTYFTHSILLSKGDLSVVRHINEQGIISEDVDSGLRGMRGRSTIFYTNDYYGPDTYYLHALSTWCVFPALWIKMFGLWAGMKSLTWMYFIIVLDMYVICKRLKICKRAELLAITLFALSPLTMYIAKAGLSEIVFLMLFVIAIRYILYFRERGYITAGIALGLIGFIHASVLIYLPVIVFALFIIINNLLTLKMNSFSGSVRLDDFSAGFKAWMVSPVFGNGYNNMKSIQQYMSSFRLNNMGFSNSPMLVLAYGGLYMAIPYMLAIYFSLKNCLENRQMICFVFLFLMMLIVTIVPFQPLVTYVFSWFITNDSNTKRDLVRLNRKYSMADLPVRK